jgi:hypothetical protein
MTAKCNEVFPDGLPHLNGMKLWLCSNSTNLFHVSPSNLCHSSYHSPVKETDFDFNYRFLLYAS